MSLTNKDFSNKKERLVQLALERFIENGYENTTITDLQKSFGLTKGGLYHYFNSKEEILDAVIEYGLTQGVKELVIEMQSVSLEKKLTYFFFSSNTNDFTRNLFKYSKNNHSSIVTYRLREKSIEILSPFLQDIVRQYIESGFYKSKYPDEMVEFCMILAKAVTEEGILPKTDLVHRKKRIDTLLDLWSKCMEPPTEHIHELQAKLYELIDYDEGNCNK